MQFATGLPGQPILKQRHGNSNKNSHRKSKLHSTLISPAELNAFPQHLFHPWINHSGVCVCVCVLMVRISVNVSMCVCVCVCVCAHMHMCVCILVVHGNTFVCMCIPTSVCPYLCTLVCLYLYSDIITKKCTVMCRKSPCMMAHIASYGLIVTQNL